MSALPQPLPPDRAASSIPSRAQSSAKSNGNGMGGGERKLPSHDELVIQRKVALKASLNDCLREMGWSRTQFADRMTQISGVTVTESKIAHWLDATPDGLRWRMSAAMGVYWTAITASRTHFDELLDELGMRATTEVDADIAEKYRAAREAEEELAQVDWRKSA